MVRFVWLCVLVFLVSIGSGPSSADVVPSTVLRLSDTQEVHADLSASAYQTLVGGLSRRGFQLVSATASQGPNGLRFSAITESAVPDRAWAARHGLTAPQALAFIDDHVGRRGWRLLSLDVYATANGFRYVVVADSRPRQGEYIAPMLAISGQAWNTVFSEQVDAGRYPAIASIAVNTQGQAVVAAFFQSAAGLRFVSWQGRGQGQFVQDHLNAARQGYAPVFLGSFPTGNGQPTYTGVWSSAAPAADILVNVSAARLSAIVSDLHEGGRRILRIAAATASSGRPVYSLHVARPPNGGALDPDGANYPLRYNSANTTPDSGSGGSSGGNFGGGFTPGGRVQPGAGGGNGGGSGNGGGGSDPDRNDRDINRPPKPENPPGPGGNYDAAPVQPGDPEWCNYYTFGGSHVGLTINSPGDSPLVSRNWGTVLCDDDLHRAEVDRGRRAEDHVLGIYVPWAQATNVSEAANCLRTNRVRWISEQPDPEVRRAWERVSGSIWDGISVRECEACGQMIAYAGMNYCRRYGHHPD